MRSILAWGVSAAAVLFLVPVCQADLVPRLVRDVDPTSYAGSSNPRQLVSLRHGFGFTALNGRELWVYDDQEDVLTRALQAEEIRQLQENFYAARGADGRWTFWDLEGFPYYSATRIGKAALGRLGTIYRPQEEGVWLLFEANNHQGRGLWTLQSSETGPIARPLPFPDGRLLHDLTAFRDRAFFVARHRDLGTALWVTDGTPAGTFPLFAPAPGKSPDLFLLGVVGRNLLLAVSGGQPELWVSDGTARGTRPLPKIGHGPGAKILRAAAGLPFLVIDDGRHGPQLWTSDGTAGGTRRLTSFSSRDPFPGPGSELPLKPLDGRWVFFADDGAHGRELWWTDGTPGGTRLLTDLCPGPCGTTGELLLTLPTADSRPERLFFSAQASGRGVELWSTDGTAAGTGLVRDLCAGPCSSDPRDFKSVYTAAIFTAATAEGPRALWTSDGTPQGTTRLTAPGVTADTGLLMDGFFAASDAAFGEELWTTDGTPEGTRIWDDLQREADSGSYPSPVGAAGGKLVFTAFDPLHLRQLWASDGTAAGTVRIPVLPRHPVLYSLPAATLGPRSVFAALGRGAGEISLWATDGTALGTVPVTPPGVEAATYPSPYVLDGTRALFLAKDAEHGTELWASDGTADSTHLVADLAPGPASIDVDSNVRATLRGQMVFRRADDDHHLWLTGGTAADTRRLLDAYPFLAPLEQAGDVQLAELPGKLCFVGSGASENQLWSSDWTAAGTRPVEIAGLFGVADLFPAGSRLFLHGSDPDGNEGLWVSDCTPGGTARIPATYYDNRFSTLRPFVFGDRLAFSDDQDTLWVTDGTAAGTFQLHGPAGSPIYPSFGGGVLFAGRLVVSAGNGFNPCYVWDGKGDTAVELAGVQCDGTFFPVGSRLYFQGFEPQTGAELWVLEEK